MASSASASPPELRRAGTGAAAAAGAGPGSGIASGAPAWADGLDLPDVGLVARIMRLNLLVTRFLDAITAAEGIATADYLVLAVVRRSPRHRTSPSRICEVLGRSTGGMTLTLDRLESEGWITRAPDPGDRRRVVVGLTPAGLLLSTRLNDALHTWERGLSLAPRRQAAMGGVDELLELFETLG